VACGTDKPALRERRQGSATLNHDGVMNFDRLKTPGWIIAGMIAWVAMMCGCASKRVWDGTEVVFLIESNPANLDARYGQDAQSQRIAALIYSGLVVRDAEMNLHGDLAESWETPDAFTYIFHLKKSVEFHDGREVTSRDVKATIAWMMNPENKSPKAGSFRMIRTIEAPDSSTVVFRLKEPYASFLWNLEKSAVGIVPWDAGAEFAKHPIGSGPFRFVSQAQDQEVVLERVGTRNSRFEKQDQGNVAGTAGRQEASAAIVRAQTSRLQDDNTGYGGDQEGFQSKPSDREISVPRVERVRFRIVPDAIVRALELRKGSADIEVSSLSADMIPVLAKQEKLTVTERPGTNFAYLGMNMEDAILVKRDVRQALAYATDRESLVKYLLHGEARLASGILPPNHWAHEANVKTYAYDPAEAERLLDAAGLRRGTDGTRFHVTLKVSTEEQARLMGAALQEQWKKVGVALEVRPLEIATLFSDLAKGNFQISYLRWVGANNDPDVFDLVFSSKRVPPNGANRGHYQNARVDQLIDGIRTEMDRQKRKELCSEVQKILAEDGPYVPLWFTDVVSVHRSEMGKVALGPTGGYEFLGR
jgi:peptide/nickel transport system substrate-binding protein